MIFPAKTLTFQEGDVIIETFLEMKENSIQGSKVTLALGNRPSIVIRKEVCNATDQETNSPLRDGVSN